MSFTLLHTADLHLGKSFSTLPPERAEQRRADILATLSRLCKLAQAQQVDLLCIAGDLFDRANPAQPLLAATRRLLAEAGVPVLLAPGNHDPLEANSPYLDTHWPGNVLIASQPGWQRMAVDGAEVWAFGYTRASAHESAWQQFPGCGTDAVLALHAACLSPGLAYDAGYYPFTPADIPPCGYLALGHHHQAVQVQRAPVAWYAGTPEPLEAEGAAPAVLRVTVDAGTTTVEPLEVATRRHRAETLDISGLSSEAIWDRALAAAATDDLLSLRLTGMLEAEATLDVAGMQAELSAKCFAVEIEADTVALPDDGVPGEGVPAVLYALTQERLAELEADDPQRTRLQRAYRYALLALEGRL